MRELFRFLREMRVREDEWFYSLGPRQRVSLLLSSLRLQGQFAKGYVHGRLRAKFAPR